MDVLPGKPSTELLVTAAAKTSAEVATSIMAVRIASTSAACVGDDRVQW